MLSEGYRWQKFLVSISGLVTQSANIGIAGARLPFSANNGTGPGAVVQPLHVIAKYLIQHNTLTPSPSAGHLM